MHRLCASLALCPPSFARSEALAGLGLIRQPTCIHAGLPARIRLAPGPL